MAFFSTSTEVLEATTLDATDCTDNQLAMDQRKNDFLATLAHELRNPLAPIINGLQLLSFMNLDEDAENVRSMMVRQVKQIVHLVDDLLDVARIDAGKVLLDKQLCIFRTIVDGAIEESSILISENDMTLEVIDDSHGACICGDPTRLTQVICNLLNNSAKYGRNGGKILLELGARSGVVIVRVQDDGIGIEPDRLQDIFQMYSQIENAKARGSAGLGIGLALVRSLVELHDGSVDVESDGANCGSTFTITLPMANRKVGVQKPRVVSNRSTRSLRVLVVDDLRAMRTVTKQLLEKLGHQVLVAENGQVAWEKLTEFHPDVVLSDIAMPVLSGQKLARLIRARAEFNTICLVALTGYGKEADRDIAFEAGFDRHLTKPVDFQSLRDLFEELDASAG